MFNSELYLIHHGIKGQKWGVKNGPPYPLDAKDHSAREKKAGWRKSLSKSNSNKSSSSSSSSPSEEPKSNTKNKFQLSEKQKKAIKIGAAIAVTGLAAYGTYRLAKNGNFDAAVQFGKQQVDSIVHGPAIPDLPEGRETNLDTLSKTNPNGYTRNCLMSSIAGFLRRQGKDVTAKNLTKTNNLLPMDMILKRCFKGATILTDGPDRTLAKAFSSSRESASELLRSRFGDNAEGVVGVNWTKEFDGGGHAFNWKITNGHVTFSDYQGGYADADKLWDIIWGDKAIDPSKYICIARLDGAKTTRKIFSYIHRAKR